MVQKNPIELEKTNWVGEDDDLKQKKQIKVEQFSFPGAYEFSFLEE